jgi:HEAT repeat protein
MNRFKTYLEVRRNLAILRDRQPAGPNTAAQIAARALGDLGDKRAVPELIRALEADNLHIQFHAVVALGKLADRRAIEPLKTISRYGHPALEAGRENAIKAIIEIETETNGSPEPYLQDPDPRLRASAISFLTEIKGPAVLENLERMSRDDQRTVRMTVASCLERIHTPGAVSILQTLITDPDGQVRAAAAAALGECGDLSAVETLVHALKDADIGVCERAAGSLGKLGSRSAAEALQAAWIGLDDRKEFGVDHARAILWDAWQKCKHSARS